MLRCLAGFLAVDQFSCACGDSIASSSPVKVMSLSFDIFIFFAFFHSCFGAGGQANFVLGHSEETLAKWPHQFRYASAAQRCDSCDPEIQSTLSLPGLSDLPPQRSDDVR